MKVDFSKLDRAFSPKCLVVIGDKKESNYMWLRSHSGFKGKLYSVQIDPNEIPGIEEVKSVAANGTAKCQLVCEKGADPREAIFSAAVNRICDLISSTSRLERIVKYVPISRSFSGVASSVN